MKFTVCLALSMTLVCVAVAPARGAEFLVRDGAEFQAALDSAAANRADDVVVLVAGVYTGKFEYRSSESQSLTIRGVAGLSRDRVILDGDDAGRVLELYTDPAFRGADYTIEVRNLTIRDGNASTESRREGGGIKANINSGSLRIVDCAILSCIGVGDGGGAYMAATGSMRVERCLISGNAANDMVGSRGRGGGLFMNVSSSADTTVVGCVVTDNFAESQGGGLWIGFQKTGARNIISNTIVGNGSPEGAGIYFYAAVTANVMNSIVYENTPEPAGQIVFRDGFVTNRVGYNNDVGTVIGGWTESGGNVDVDPGFVDAAGDDYRLRPDSPLVDAGRNVAPGMINYDYAANPRIIDSGLSGEPVVDIGAYERYAVRYGTLGSEVVLAGTGFGAKKPKVYLLYEKKPGKYKKANLKVLEYSDGRIVCLFKKKKEAGAYPLFCQPREKGSAPIGLGEFDVSGPELDVFTPTQAAPGHLVTLTGRFFSTKKPKIYFANIATGKRKKAKVKRIEMDPLTGLSEVLFAVPKLESGPYLFSLVSKIGDATTTYTVSR